jgi:TRAP-type C4-dicarboxylate transport system substrate-binding protein
MKVNKALLLTLAGLVLLTLLAGPVLAQQKASPMDAWKPAFDPAGAKYKAVVSNVSSPAIKGVFAGFAIRDELWKRTKGQIYFDYKPFSILGGEVEVLNQLKMGAIQGMAVSSVAATNLGPRFGVVNLPFLIDSFEKLDKFVANKKMFDHFMNAMEHQGIMGLDITGYGNYGWASKTPVKSLEDAKKVKFRIAEAEVNKLTYNAWGMNPVVMPWPDVPMAMKTGTIDGLDHTLVVCSITKKFEDAKFFTQVNYAQGLFIWIFNKAWFNTLPADLQKTFTQTIHDIAADIRKQGRGQEEEEIAKAKAAGVTFYTLSAAEMATLRKMGDPVHFKYSKEINQLHPTDTYKPQDFLKEVQELMGYKP